MNAKQTKEQQTEKIFERFETPKDLVERVEQIESRFTSGAELSPEDREIAGAVIADFLRIRRAQLKGRPKLFASDKERYDYHNARRRKVKE